MGSEMCIRDRSDKIERLQKIALKIIYGFSLTYEELLAKSGLHSLQYRRKEAFKKFAASLASSDRYGNEWFPLKNTARSLRKEKKYEEFYARTDRLYNSPLYKMRRILNEENY